MRNPSRLGDVPRLPLRSPRRDNRSVRVSTARAPPKFRAHMCNMHMHIHGNGRGHGHGHVHMHMHMLHVVPHPTPPHPPSPTHSRLSSAHPPDPRSPPPPIQR